MNLSTMERRRFERLPLRLPVQVRVSNSAQATHSFTENISGEGVYFTSVRRLSAGQQLEVVVMLPIDDSLRNGPIVRLVCKSAVVRVDSAGQGQAFGIACRIESYSVQFGEADSQCEPVLRSAKA